MVFESVKPGFGQESRERAFMRVPRIPTANPSQRAGRGSSPHQDPSAIRRPEFSSKLGQTIFQHLANV
jgi:hypothetical protein